jgi:hypothetical protein
VIDGFLVCLLVTGCFAVSFEALVFETGVFEEVNFECAVFEVVSFDAVVFFDVSVVCELCDTGLCEASVLCTLRCDTRLCVTGFFVTTLWVSTRDTGFFGADNVTGGVVDECDAR